ncbi:MAG: NAD(P)/FAD-dependent oxidoreductase [Pseudorhizobium sp.]
MPRIIVIGSGIVGSAITYNLAIRGADVLLLDQGHEAGTGVTGKAFGWINVINGTPGERSYALWRDAIAEYRQLANALPSAFASVRRGSVLWKGTAEETEQFAQLHQKAGERIELLDQGALHVLEPHLRQVPDLAAFAPDDLALDPGQLAQDLVGAACSAGAKVRFDTAVSAIESDNGKVSGVRIVDQQLAADVVVLAAGAGVQALTNAIGIETGIATSPALLLRYSCDHPLINHILRGPRLEVRQARDGTLLVAKSYKADSAENTPNVIGEQMLAIMKEELVLPEGVRLISAKVGERPVFADGLPRLGFLPEIGNLFLAVGHPGVILAPLIGRLTAEQILQEQSAIRRVHLHG